MNVVYLGFTHSPVLYILRCTFNSNCDNFSSQLPMWGIGHWAMGNGQWAMEEGKRGAWTHGKSPMPNAPYPMPHAQCPMPYLFYGVMQKLAVQLYAL
ncbi:hypothetical protein H6G81_32390 [Scytonema hofmannii FACHB-248]|uniref:Uncharacterized protein n=2 Tax=Nostocales TaxID=1161 RepID=A0ABR8H1E9_9CYAN|nr:hypothetical protein [Scytonema hofmannii]MBD2609091.1 hypothetical protein [Scytonema hofmannii FACHB-248]